MFENLSPIAALGLGILVGAFALLPSVLLLRKRGLEAEEDRERIEAVAVKAREILGASPDGLFLWDRVNGGVTCSRRLAGLLSLPEGTHSRFTHLVEKFDDATGRDLQAAVDTLHKEGTPFDLILPVKGTAGRRLIQAVGAQAVDGKGAVLADLVWMRDLSATAALLAGPAAAAVLPDGQSLYLRRFLDALPFPVWLRDPKLKVCFTNRAALQRRVAGPDLEQAQEALKSGRPVERVQELVDAGEVNTYDVIECPVADESGEDMVGDERLIGYALTTRAAPGTGDAGGDAPAPAASGDGGSPPAAAIESPPPPPEDSGFTGLAPHISTAGPAGMVLSELTLALAIFGADTRITFANRAYQELWRLDAEWLDEGPEFGDILEYLRTERRLPEVPDFRAYKMEQLQQFDDVSVATGDLMHLPDGRTLRAMTYPVPGGGLAFSYEDVTDQLDLERSVNALDAVQKATMDNLFEAIAVFGSDGRVKFSNPAFSQLWNLPAGEMAPGTHLTDFVDAIRPLANTGGDWEAQKKKTLASMLQRRISHGRIERSDDRVIKFANIPLPDGAVLITYLDITDDTKLEQALMERAAALKDANRLKSEFIAQLSQQIRMPLTSITGFGEMLAGEYFGPLQARQKEYAEAVVETSRALMEVVSNTLELAAIEAEQIELELSRVDVNGLLAEVVKMHEDRARKKHLEIAFNVTPDAGQITADDRRLKQAIFNLMSNAISFTPAHGRVTITAKRNGRHVDVSIADTGPGIAPEDQERIFQPFEQLSEPGEAPSGPGLGLTLVRSFIELHGGQIQIASEPGQGTTITCTLPAE